jgi:hypothetical protein
MEIKHTPAPWSLATGEFGHHNIFNAIHKNGVADVMGRPRCGRPEDIPSATEEGLANARLIAAAPELLQALVVAKSLIEAWYSCTVDCEDDANALWSTYEKSDEEMILINNAILKAMRDGKGT